MSYENDINFKNVNFKYLKFANFENINCDQLSTSVPVKSSSMCYNFSCKDGVLVDGMGVGDLEFRSNIYEVGYRKPIIDIFSLYIIAPESSTLMLFIIKLVSLLRLRGWSLLKSLRLHRIELMVSIV